MIIALQEALVLEVPDDFERLCVRLKGPHVQWLANRVEDRGKYSGTTLGAYRRGKSMRGFREGAIEVWVACARQESATGAPWPHCYFIQVVGRGDAEDISIYCPSCRAEKPWERRQRTEAPIINKSTRQLSLF